MEAGQPAVDVFDAHSGELSECWAALFDPKTAHFKQAVQDNYEPFRRDLLLLDLIEVLPAHRRRFLGLRIASTLIDVFGGGCGLVACKPFPLQLREGIESEAGFSAKMKFGEMEQNATVELRRIRKYWSKLGLTRVGRTPV